MTNKEFDAVPVGGKVRVTLIVEGHTYQRVSRSKWVEVVPTISHKKLRNLVSNMTRITVPQPAKGGE